MRPFVGVSQDLSPVSAALRDRGYDVVVLGEGGPGPAHALDAMVVSGERRGMLGVWRTEPSVPVVDADGKSPKDVVQEVEAALRYSRQG